MVTGQHKEGETRSMNAKTYTCAACSTPTGPMWQAKIDGYTWEFCDTCHAAIANAPVASQEPQDSPIVARVDELLGETETDTADGFQALYEYGNGAQRG